MNREQTLRRRIKGFTWLFIVGLVVSGATAIPLQQELDWLVNCAGARQLVETPVSTNPPEWALWLVKVQTTLHEVNEKFPFLAYGTDWLAFGHFVHLQTAGGCLSRDVLFPAKHHTDSRRRF